MGGRWSGPSLSLFLISLLPLFAADQQAVDRISELPGQPPVAFAQFAGYVTVNQEKGRALFYWLTEAVTDAAKKPLVLWLNGVTTATSLASSHRSMFDPTTTHGNPLLIRAEANLLFLESPAGVGFSYANASSDLQSVGDERTGKGRHAVFLTVLTCSFSSSFFSQCCSSRCLGVLDSLDVQIPALPLCMQVGNAVTDNYYDSLGTVFYWWTHSMISDSTYKSILSSCDFRSPRSSRKCDHVVSYAVNHEFGDIDQYSIYTPSCTASNATDVQRLRFKNSLIHRRAAGYDPCVEKRAEKYYNRPDVQKAMHANTSGIPYRWTACRYIAHYSPELLGFRYSFRGQR
ncbi:hypothetical protein BHM03_00020024 [Ensete ventricosum]|nr:hypothetical protein BHM03_00020024 [Ensete ventricosum]